MAEKVIMKRDAQCPHCGVEILRNEIGYQKDGVFYDTQRCAVDEKMVLRRTLPPPSMITFGDLDEEEAGHERNAELS